jgi:energy-converting hydrogenase Eha subunit A
MILATVTNGGIIYMIYPALVFGIALMEEDKPGRKFWFFTLIYTQIILLVQFVA